MRLVDATDATCFGGKTASLARALGAGLPVPDGVALSVVDATAVANDDPDRGVAVRDEVAALSPPLALRSSAIGEDGSEASFAGQHLTVLGVDGWAAAARAIAAVRASASEAGALAYRERRGIGGAPAVAVLVQEMVPAEVAGVAFTRDPETGAELCVVEAAWGLGRSVVEGLVVPDHLHVSASGEVLTAEAGLKDVEIVLDGGGDGTMERPVEPERAGRLCLEPARAASVARLATRCEALLGGPQDVEWAFAGDDLWLLQSRPLTAAGGGPVASAR